MTNCSPVVYEEAPRPEPVADASFVIGTVCVLRPEKALHLLQEAFARTLASGAEVRNPRAFLAKVAIRAAMEEVRRRPQPGPHRPAPARAFHPGRGQSSGRPAAMRYRASVRRLSTGEPVSDDRLIATAR